MGNKGIVTFLLLSFDTSNRQKFQKDIFTLNIKIFLRLILIFLFYNSSLHRHPKYFTQIFSLNEPLDRDVYYCQTHNQRLCGSHFYDTLSLSFPFSLSSSLLPIKIALLTGSGGKFLIKTSTAYYRGLPPFSPPFCNDFFVKK